MNRARHPPFQALITICWQRLGTSSTGITRSCDRQAVVNCLLSPALNQQAWLQTSAATQRPMVDLARGFASLATRSSIPTTACRCTVGYGKCSAGCKCECQGLVEARRSYADTCRLKPKFQGGKIKVRTSYKERFKAMKDGTVKVFPAGFRHRRSRKSNAQRLRLKQPQKMHHTYANTLKRMGFMS